ncbi:hypothetical protein CspeluHIS016_0902900 [Cutaneotrichosporon spelunceum]|uniref:Uncharacterized protein n=1 Tax=Cutaneotrichosporon spelunceum TaxID=1672016 RepID=A0AAD3U032_9TREE|nr:hypothetical protein CspeluHIS016_0902900 [Cutaneotrichosporon spelunceum]
MRTALLLPLFFTGALAQRFTTTIGDEVVVATAFTTAGQATTRILDTIDTVEKTTQSFTPSGSISFATDTYSVAKPTRIATLGDPPPAANSGLTRIKVTETTSAVPSGTRQDLPAYQSARMTAMPSSAAASALPAAPLFLAVAAVYALV